MSAVKISRNSGEMPGKIVCPREESLVYKVFDSGLKQSLFLPGLSALSTKLITVQRALFCLVCLFLPTAHPTSPSLTHEILSFLFPLFLFLSPLPIAISLDLCVVVSFLSLFLSLPSRLSFSPQTFCRMACFTAGTAGLLRLRPVCLLEKSPLRSVSIVVAAASRWRGCARFSIIARVLPSPEERSRDSRVHLPCLAPPRRAELRCAAPRCAALNRHGRKPRYAQRDITITIRCSGSELKAQLLNNGMSRDVLYVSRLCRTKCYRITHSPAIRGRAPLDVKAHRRGCPSASESMRRCRCRRRGVGDSRVGGGVPSTAGKGYGRLQGAPAAHVSRGGAAWRDVGVARRGMAWRGMAWRAHAVGLACSFRLASSPFRKKTSKSSNSDLLQELRPLT
ncbi:hypothetical protein G5I_02964 [Acromyrmex echinatior]|uniref:Uncharacterized protein n=1 Tax=Acromyrmex echinatior TaxID=103372 RepID=F4WBP5_ACREC|nr:hypothetical protein G5I_02964 [Acromyrmex echinatior]